MTDPRVRRSTGMRTRSALLLALTGFLLAIAAISLSIPGVIIPLVAVNAAGHERFPMMYGFMLAGTFTGLGLAAPARGPGLRHHG